MIILIENNRIISSVNVSSEDEFLKLNPNYIKTDFQFKEDIDLYEFDGNRFVLIDGWEKIKKERVLSKITGIEYIDSVPQQLSKVQAMKALKEKGIWESFKTVVASNEDANDEWMLSTKLERNHGFVESLAPALNLTGEDLDELFILGAKF